MTAEKAPIVTPLRMRERNPTHRRSRLKPRKRSHDAVPRRETANVNRQRLVKLRATQERAEPMIAESEVQLVNHCRNAGCESSLNPTSAGRDN
jgi:primosomal protein N''